MGKKDNQGGNAGGSDRTGFPTFQAVCYEPSCNWTGGYYATERDRDNAVRLHTNRKHY